jgi:hypothetical protein
MRCFRVGTKVEVAEELFAAVAGVAGVAKRSEGKPHFFAVLASHVAIAFVSALYCL